MKKKQIIILGLISLTIILYTAMPNSYSVENSLILHYKDDKVKELLILDSLESLAPITLKLYDQKYARHFYYEGIKNDVHYYAYISLTDSLANLDISNVSQYIQVTFTSLVPFWKKISLLFKKASLRKSLADYVAKHNARYAKAKKLYGINGKVVAVKDTFAYTETVHLSNTIQLYQQLNIAFEKSLAFSKKYHLFPGNFAFHLSSDTSMLTCAWVSNIKIKGEGITNRQRKEAYKVQKMPSTGYLYQSDILSLPKSDLTLLPIMMSKLKQLTSDRGYQQIALPFAKIITLGKETIKIQFYLPITLS